MAKLPCSPKWRVRGMSNNGTLPHALTIDDIASRFPGAVRNSRGGYEARCPAHTDSRRSLSINPGEKQLAVIRCGRNCETKIILAAVGLTMKDICNPSSNGSNRTHAHRRAQTRELGQIVKVYPYVDEGGKLLFEV